MITTTQMYWLTRLDEIRGLAIALIVLPVVLSIISGVVYAKPKWFLRCLLVVIMGVLIGVFVPSTKQMAAIIVVPKIANSEKVQTVGNELYNLAVEWMEELRPAKAKGENERIKRHEQQT